MEVLLASFMSLLADGRYKEKMKCCRHHFWVVWIPIILTKMSFTVRHFGGYLHIQKNLVGFFSTDQNAEKGIFQMTFFLPPPPANMPFKMEIRPCFLTFFLYVHWQGAEFLILRGSCHLGNPAPAQRRTVPHSSPESVASLRFSLFWTHAACQLSRSATWPL